jgi:hypothetical protein
MVAVVTSVAEASVESLAGRARGGGRPGLAGLLPGGYRVTGPPLGGRNDLMVGAGAVGLQPRTQRPTWSIGANHTLQPTRPRLRQPRRPGSGGLP